ELHTLSLHDALPIYHRVCRVVVRGQQRPEVAQPLELVLVVIVVERPTVGHVCAGDAHTATGGPHQAGVGVCVVGPEPVHGIFDADPAEYGHAVPTPFAVVHGLVAHRLEGECREGSVGQLRLL